MERVTGLGGLFVASPDPERLQRWYAEHLGVAAPPAAEGEQEWQQEAGPTAFAAFRADEAVPYVGPRGFGLSFRVTDLEAMVRQLRGAGIEVDVDARDYPYGRFAALHDPDGNPVQLWQPS